MKLVVKRRLMKLRPMIRMSLTKMTQLRMKKEKR